MNKETMKMKIITIVAATIFAMSASGAFAGGIEHGPRGSLGVMSAGPDYVPPASVFYSNGNAVPGDFAESDGLGAGGRAAESVTGLPAPGTSNSPGPNEAGN
jgi:hypothetical protein